MSEACGTGGAPILWVVIPCYNEQEVLPETAPLFRGTVESLIATGSISPESKICFVNDGSSDTTWDLIRGLADASPVYEGISLSRNRGHQNAVLAGLMEARHHCDACVSIDCDGQDDMSKISDMVDCFRSGYDVVYGVRSSRDSDTLFKRFTAEGFYRLLNAMGVEVVFNHADYRLLSARALDALSQFSEVNLFLRGMVPMLGFPSTTVEYRREPRVAGSSHYPLAKMVGLAFDGITSMSVTPIRLITCCGFCFSLLGFLAFVWAIVNAISGNTVAGWASIVCLICLLGGIILLSLGVIGEYVGKIYLEVKRRPRFIVSERTWER